jgi:hypothetical protein
VVLVSWRPPEEPARSTCRHCRAEIFNAWTLYGSIWTAAELQPTGVDPRACPSNAGFMIYGPGAHEPTEPTEGAAS